jgi:hypothetical protein
MLAQLKVVNIMNMYESLIYRQMSIAYSAAGFPPFNKEDFQAKFNKCGPTGADIHYRMPGIPDIAMKIWLAYIATGLGEEVDRTNGFEKKVGMISFWSA